MIQKVLAVLETAGIEPGLIENLIEVPSDPKLGDYALPCFALAKQLKKSPQQIAEHLAKEIAKGAYFEKIEAVGPYLNFYVNSSKLAEQTLSKIEKEKKKYGMGDKTNIKVMIEYSQANTHKAFHVGHIRGTSLGESIARIRSFYGDRAVRVNYQGDSGMHVAKWMWGYLNHHAKEKPRADAQWFADIYVESVKEIGKDEKKDAEVRELNKKLDEATDAKLTKLWKETRKLSLEAFEPIYSDLQTHFDEYFFESESEERGKAISYDLVKRKIAKESQRAIIIDFADHGEPNLGVWVLLRADGTVLYSAKDLALAERKFNEFKIDTSIYVIGAAQRHHVMQLFKTLQLMGFEHAKDCIYVPITEIRLPWGKMSSRTGENVLYHGLKEELVAAAQHEIQERDPHISNKELEERSLALAIAAMKYAMLKQDVHKSIIFDPKEAVRFEGDTGPYLLYSYARAQSILRKASRTTQSKAASLSAEEKALISKLAAFEERVAHAYEQNAPAVIAHYGYELAQTFNEFYHASQVIGSEQEGMRVRMVKAFTIVMQNALYLLGIPTIDEM